MMTTRILLIDDEPRWINFAQNDLVEGRFDIVVAADLETAIEKLEENKYDLVIASSRRLDVLEIIKERFSDKKVIITTVQPSVKEALTSYRLGARGYFAKSFGQNDLLNHVEEIVQPKTNGS